MQNWERNPFTVEGEQRRPYFQPLPDDWPTQKHADFNSYVPILMSAAENIIAIAKKRGAFRKSKRPNRKKTLQSISSGIQVVELPEDIV